MKKKINMILITIFMIIINLNCLSLATTEDVQIKSTKTTVKSGDTFTITISQESNGISAIDAQLEYDSNVFELIDSIGVAKNWTNMGDGNKLSAITSSGTKVNSGDIFTITLKVKDNVNTKTSEIKLKQIELYTDYDQESIKIQDKKIDISVNNETTNNNNNNNNQNQPSIENKDSQNTDGNKPNTDSQNANDKSNNAKSSSNKENNSKNSTVATSSLPKTGNIQTLLLIIAVIILIVIIFISYRGYKKYKGI